MKHAIMVIGYGNDASVLQETINILDDVDIDFFIHWDKKYKIPKLNSKKSRIIFIPRISVNWGTDTQVIAEKRLIGCVLDSNQNYDYVHLISSTDMPLMTVDYFKRFFKTGTCYVGFIDELTTEDLDKLRYFYPIRNLDIRSKFNDRVIIRLIRFINKLLGINRLKNVYLEKGCQWFSMDISYAKKIFYYNNYKLFMHSYGCDEYYVPTILSNQKPDNFNKKYDMTNAAKMAVRYIDWSRGNPYEFVEDNVEELQGNVNTHYAFARKIIDSKVVKKVFSK